MNPLRRLWHALATWSSGWRISQAEGASSLWYAQQSAAGMTVDQNTALSLSAVFGAVNVLSRLVGSLPLGVFRRIGRFKEPALTHPAYRLLHGQPNPEMTASTFRRTLEWHRLLGGNAYAEITWAGNGKPAALWPIEAYRVKPKRREDGALYYEVDGNQEIEPEDILHVPLVSSDGVTGHSFLDWACESLGLGMAAQQYAATYFGQGARPGVILRHPGNPTAEARKEMRRSWNERHQGSGKAQGTGVLWGGWEYEADGSADPEKSQLLEQRKFTVEEVARWLGVPAVILQALATAGTLEQQGLQFLAFSLGPVLTDYEQEYDRKMLSPPQVYSKHNVGGLLRGDHAARGAFYGQMVQIGVYSPNDCRDLEDLNPVDGGDVHFFPLNMVPLHIAALGPQTAPPAPAPPPANPGLPPAPPPSGQPGPPVAPPAPSQPMRAILSDTFGRLARVEQGALRRAVQKPGEFMGWLDSWYPAHEARLAEALQAPLLATGSPLAPIDVARRWCLASRKDLLDLADQHTAKTLASGAAQLITDWARRSESETTLILEGNGHAPTHA